MRFLVDNSLSPRLAQGLGHSGHDAVHVRELGLAAANDDAVFAAAAGDRRIIVAQDTDFGTILATRGESKPSVVVFRCRAKSTETLLPLLLANLSAVREDLEAGAVVVLEDTRIRVRRLPISAHPRD